MEGKQSFNMERSPAYPPPHAWKEPEQWIDLKTGYAKRGVERLPTPVDDRDFVKIDELVSSVRKELFVDDYEWPFSPDDVKTRPDNHHFYHDAARYRVANFDGDEAPSTFRSLPVHIGHMPRQFHNVIHRFVEIPPVPNLDHMREFVVSYNLAFAAFRQLYLSAEEAVRLHHQQNNRRYSVPRKRIKPKTIDDRIADDFMQSSFRRHFDEYSRAVEQFQATDNKELVYNRYEALRLDKPSSVVKTLGRIVARKSININLRPIAA